MLNLAAVCFAFLPSATVIDGTVVDIAVTRKFAGKLGYLVTQKLTIEANGTKYTVTLPPHHSRSRVLDHQFKVGESYQIRR